MASVELQPFKRCDTLQLVAAIETPNTHVLQLGFWVTDPLQQMIWPAPVAGHPRHHGLWQQTCFELFIGIDGQDDYREINLSPSGAWQAYAFEEYRYPDTSPPQTAHDIDLIQLQRTKFGITAALDIQNFLNHHQVRLNHIYCGISAVCVTAHEQQYFALQHSTAQPDFHNKRDWQLNFN